jgi:hypothetical protein
MFREPQESSVFREYQSPPLEEISVARSLSRTYDFFQDSGAEDGEEETERMSIPPVVTPTVSLTAGLGGRRTGGMNTATAKNQVQAVTPTLSSSGGLGVGLGKKAPKTDTAKKKQGLGM